MTEYICASIFSDDISRYLDYLKNGVCSLSYWRLNQSALRSLDRYCVSIHLRRKTLTSELVSDWQQALTLSSSVKPQYRSVVRGFSKYLVSIGVCDKCIDRFVRPHYQYSSVFAIEIQTYLALRGRFGGDIHYVQSALRSLDRYLTVSNLRERNISEQLMNSWFESRKVGTRMKQTDLCVYKGFAKYLISLGIPAHCSVESRTVKPPYEFASPMSKEINGYLRLLSEAGRYPHVQQSALRSLDRYLVSVDFRQRTLPEQIILEWQKALTISVMTRGGYISCMKGFVSYLVSLGIDASCPEPPRSSPKAIPHSFSPGEISRIFDVVDNFENTSKRTRSAAVFPILLRILYGCGLRIEECCRLRWKDVDLDNGIITIRIAKNRKQRFVPMDWALTETLRDYREYVLQMEICGDFLFESDKTPGQYFRQNTFYEWFRKALETAGIDRTKTNPHHRGICPNCLRHTFTLNSFLKGEESGTPFEDYAPFLAAYLGHESPKETEAYLRSNYNVYTQSHQRVGASISYVFPEVQFEED